MAGGEGGKGSSAGAARWGRLQFPGALSVLLASQGAFAWAGNARDALLCDLYRLGLQRDRSRTIPLQQLSRTQNLTLVRLRLCSDECRITLLREAFDRHMPTHSCSSPRSSC